MMTPMPTTEHQGMVVQLASVLQEAIGWSGLGTVFPGINLSARDEDWEQDYRVPHVGVFLKNGSAVDCDTHWRGAADFLIEITGPNDRTREKLPFYERLGVVELLLVDRQSWTLELYRREMERLQEVGRSSVDAGLVLASRTVPLTFQLLSGDPRPQVRLTHVDSGRKWLVRAPSGGLPRA